MSRRGARIGFKEAVKIAEQLGVKCLFDEKDWLEKGFKEEINSNALNVIKDNLQRRMRMLYIVIV